MMSFTITLALLLLAVLILGILFACHCLGPRAANWMRMRSSKEEKIGLSNHKQKLFHANGYMASVSILRIFFKVYLRIVMPKLVNKF